MGRKSQRKREKGKEREREGGEEDRERGCVSERESKKVNKGVRNG